MRVIVRIIGLVTTLALASCSAGDIALIKAASAPLPAAQVWAVDVTGCQKASECSGLRSSLVFRLTAAKLLQHAVPANQPAPLSLGIAVTHLHAVGAAARSTYGLLAGRNEVTAIVTLKTDSGITLRSFKVTVKGGDYPHEDTVEDAYRQFDTDVIAALEG